MVEKHVEKSKLTVKATAPTVKPQVQPQKSEEKQAPKPAPAAEKGEPKDEAQTAAVTQEGPKREKVPLRAKKVLSEFEKGFLAAADAAMKVAYEHERAKSVGTPIADAIQNLEPEGE